VNITLIGGEPCIYPSFFKLAEQLTKKHYISLTTNLSRDFKVFAERIDPCRMNGGIGASFHPAFAEFNSFLARVLFLKKKGFVVWVCYVAYPPQLKQMAHYKKRFKQNGLNFIVQPFRGFYKNVPYPESYTERDKEYIRQITEEDERVLMDMEYQLDRKSTKGRLCAAGQMLAHILPDASAWRCSEHQESNFCLGSILDENFRLLDAPLACKSETCPCDYLYLLD